MRFSAVKTSIFKEIFAHAANFRGQANSRASANFRIGRQLLRLRRQTVQTFAYYPRMDLGDLTLYRPRYEPPTDERRTVNRMGMHFGLAGCVRVCGRSVPRAWRLGTRIEPRFDS